MDRTRLGILAHRRKAIALVLLVAAMVAAVVVAGVLAARPARAADREVRLAASAGAPHASGVAQVELEASILDGSIRAKGLPAQPFGSGRFYGAWFVRTDTGDKAFLGTLIEDDSIIFSQPGDGSIRFAATQFTTGPHAGSPVTLGSAGSNLIIVLIENKVNGLTPSPVGPVPGTGAAVSGTF
jgi:hypothetical protein